MNSLKLLPLWCLLLLSPTLGTAQTAIPNTFQPGTPARASEVNENFSVLADAINANRTAIDEGGLIGPPGPPGPAGAAGPPGPQGDPGTDAVTILDLSTGLVVIDTPGYYVLDRDWDFRSLQVVADRVTVDLRGFTLFDPAPGLEEVITISGNYVTVRNGRIIVESYTAIQSDGADTVVESMWVRGSAETYGLGLHGERAILRNSYIRTGRDGLALRVGPYAVVQSNTLIGYGFALDLPSHVVLVAVQGNVITCGNLDCMRIRGSANVISDNAVLSIDHVENGVIWVTGTNNLLSDNSFVTRGDGPAILIDGTANLLKGNLILPCYRLPQPPCEYAPWPIGIVFTQDGNFYGGNLVSAGIPFDLRGTAQTDLGGNVGF